MKRKRFDISMFDSWIDRVKVFFTEQPDIVAAFQITPGYLTGLRVSPKEKKIQNSFILPLEGEILKPSFYKNNILESDKLAHRISEGAKKLNLSNSIPILFPF